MRTLLGSARIAASIATASLLVGSPGYASESGIAHYKSPVTAWLARAPASCVLTSYFDDTSTGLHFPRSPHVAYWIGNAMKHDFKSLNSQDPRNAWIADLVAEAVVARYDPKRHVAAFEIGHTDMSLVAAFLDQPAPPSNAPPMRTDLSWVSLGGNVHLGDSLATVASSLGLHALAPTNIPSCPGLSAVEVCGWNVAGCLCPNTIEDLHGQGTSGTIIFRDARVIGLVEEDKCFAGG